MYGGKQDGSDFTVLENRAYYMIMTIILAMKSVLQHLTTFTILTILKTVTICED